MKIEELIKQMNELQQKYPGIDVSVFDWRKNLGDDSGDGSCEGIYSEFNVSVVELKGEEAEFYKEQHGQEFTPWIAIDFSNEDYNDDGILTAEQ